MKTKTKFIIGRWNIFHNGHGTLLRQGLADCDKLVVFIGSAFQARNPRNPFTWQERAEMVRAATAPSDRDRLVFVPVRDYFDDARWLREVRAAMQGYVEPNKEPIFVGYEKDWTSSYLRRLNCELERVTQEVNIGATELRDVYFSSQDTDAALRVISQWVSPGVLAYLDAWRYTKAFEVAKREHASVQAYLKKYGPGPHNTADALVEVKGQILLQQRCDEFGDGLWALPGGFLDPNETFLKAALRELGEETGFPIPEFTLLDSIQGRPYLLDNPLRSCRGRIISNMYHFKLNWPLGQPAPEVRASHESKKVRYFTREEIIQMEDQLFDDHFMAIDAALHLLPR